MVFLDTSFHLQIAFEVLQPRSNIRDSDHGAQTASRVFDIIILAFQSLERVDGDHWRSICPSGSSYIDAVSKSCHQFTRAGFAIEVTKDQFIFRYVSAGFGVTKWILLEARTHC